jgi:hypothetical protein
MLQHKLALEFDKYLGIAGLALSLCIARTASGQYDCSSSDPTKWPSPAKPYFMIAFDTSGSMSESITGNPASSCGYGSNKLAHGRCAIQNTVKAYSGQVNMGVASFAHTMYNCSGSTCTCNNNSNNCFSNCSFRNFTGNVTYDGCGPRPGDATTRAGANILQPIVSDLDTPTAGGNAATLLTWADNSCSGSSELFANGYTPLNGILRDMYRYFSSSWTRATSTPVTYTSPLRSTAQGERACRSVNVILVTDGAETCDQPADAVNAARDLYNGFTKDGIPWHVRTYVIDFASAAGASDNIADLGDDGLANTSIHAYYAADETNLSQALSDIISRALQPEACDNQDNNCNGCVDEGYAHYCNTGAGKTCCAWNTAPERQTCLNNYVASIATTPPNGDTALLPCTTPAQAQPQTTPSSAPPASAATWLCYNPGELCDNQDNNCNTVVDENQNRCGNPLHCPVGETCNGQDDDCDGYVDNGVCAGCVPSSEVCDGCDNDCDGIADNGIGLGIACGLPTPSYCAGVQTCNAQPVPAPGRCIAVSYGDCNNNPRTETCDGTDENCNGIIDDGLQPAVCAPPGTPTSLIYKDAFPQSQCVRGQQPCGGTCQGFVGPTAEICDGIDNDCNGVVDDGTLAGTGLQCGKDTGECELGHTACENGALVCKGGVSPTDEICDGKDNNCNGQIDETPLVDAPPATANGCWSLPGTSCSFENLHWDAPSGATCFGDGSLSPPCSRGSLVCTGGGWICQGANPPSAEICDGLDNNCDGQVDNGTLPNVGTSCGVSATPPCTMGTTACQTGTIVCVGNVDPKAETCNGIDDDCSGVKDDHIGWLGQPCGVATPPCLAGTYACVNGQQVCEGAVGPDPEVCDGKDNDCDTFIDEGPLTDAPAAGQQGCWSLAGTQCSFKNLTWSPPAGASCYEVGSLVYPCSAGRLQCTAGAWTCAASTLPGTEQCDGIDNDCNGRVDDVPTLTCVPNGTPATLVYNDTFTKSQCQRGHQTCGQCAGFVGPSPEICDGIDNDCDGEVDEQAVGAGVACGATQPPCSPGVMACVNATLTCVGGVGPTAEICDGIDNNCNGSIDEAPLADAPSTAQNGCWDLPGDACKFGALTWSFPAGASCTDSGSGSDKLTTPCHPGFLVCSGTQGWQCKNARDPSAEICDGIDNNCNGIIDEGTLPNTGVDVVCGSNVGECRTGHIECSKGVLSCVGGVQPTDEICDGKDNNCNDSVDDGLPTGGPCRPTYDTNLYPGQRTQGACQLGHLECDSLGGTVCVGGTGPHPEICDGIDNDCDGLVDETGSPADGIDGTLNPVAGSTAHIGDSCGETSGQCVQGKWTCRYGIFACIGGSTRSQEQCDCLDNDCDGIIDNQPDGGPALCGTGKICVSSGGSCFCAPPCQTGEFACPGGQACVTADMSTPGSGAASVCVPQVNLCKGDCSTKTVKDTNGRTLCAPLGTDDPGCQNTPACKCFSKSGCEDPCFNVQCGSGEVCARFGAKAGQCVTNSCDETGCEGCNLVCRSGECVSNPCTSTTCAANQVCRASADLKSHECDASCAGVTCSASETCHNGACVPTCATTCTSLQVCDPSTRQCITNQCVASNKTCPANQCCNALAGTCGPCPCDGIVCPKGQSCSNGECGTINNSAAGGSGSTSDAGLSGAQSQSGNSSVTETTQVDRKAYGRPTGGGGCGCRIDGTRRTSSTLFAITLGILSLGLRRRKRAKQGSSADNGGAL